MKINSQKCKLHLLRLASQLLLVNLVLVSCPVLGQVKPTKFLTAADYHLWSTIDRLKMSDDGTWVSYHLTYESGADTLFMRHTENGKIFSFPNASNESFNGFRFNFIDSKHNFKTHGLDGQNSFTVTETDRYTYVNKGKLIALLRKDSDHGRKLEIRNCNGNIIKTVSNVESFVCSPAGNKLSYITFGDGVSKIGILYFGKSVEDSEIISSAKGKIVNPVWQQDDASLAFVLKDQNAVLYSYRLNTKRLFSVVPQLRNDFPPNFRFAAFQSEFLTVSDDGSRISFLLEENQIVPEENPTGPEVWNADDTYLQPAQPYHSETRISVWMPEKDFFFAVGRNLEAVILMAGDGRYAITADISPYVPSIKFDSDADYYITDCNTGIKTLLLKQYLGESEKMMESPDGKYLSYFRDGDWWLYNLATQQHINVTRGSATSFAAKDVYGYSVSEPFGEISWSADGKSIYAYSKNDIWQISCDGESPKRLTKGLEQGLIMRFRTENNYVANRAFFTRKARVIDLNKPVILEAGNEDNTKNGYYTLTANNAEKKITLEEQSLKQLVKAANNDSYAYLSQDADVPPAIMLQSGNIRRKIYQSNSHYTDFGSSKSELVEYEGYNGEKLKGVLFYPYNYNPGVKYPMVVYIYQKLSMYQHQYQNPSMYDSEGFNATNFTSRGYFVLFPDINYEIGKPGISATTCVLAATKAAIKNSAVDEGNIGLIGHSFGGYETNFIITQTAIFKAAVSGSAVADLQQSYLSLSRSYKRPTFWYYEYYQGRMGKTLFDDWNNYLENSPVYHAEKIQTPLLLWTGADDNQVPSTQTMAFYMALRRLNKSCKMLIYPKEGHALKEPVNQEDLSNRILNWFDHHLKGVPLCEMQN